MMWGNILFTVCISYYILLVIDLFRSKKYRKFVKERNNRLEELRKIPIKTLEEQKEFIDMKYGNDFVPFKLSWRLILNMAVSIIKFGIIYWTITQSFYLTHINIPLWLSIILIIIFPIVLHFILKVFGLQQDNNLVNMLR